MSPRTPAGLVGTDAWEALRTDPQLQGVREKHERALRRLGVLPEERGFAIGFLEGMQFVLGLPEERNREMLARDRTTETEPKGGSSFELGDRWVR